LSFAQKSPRGGICILSANGAISKVALRQLGSSGGDILTYEACSFNSRISIVPYFFVL
jgi:hypothetical protein